jgi:hypothetical protein
MQSVKLGLSSEELRMVTDPSVILTKNAIIAKVYDMFGMVAEIQRQLPLPDEALHIAPKISRGENYKGLPYVMLDYPRLFTSGHVLAIRTHFWWGNYFSVVLHLKGQYKERYISTLLDHYEKFCDDGYQFCAVQDEWEHELAGPWYKAVSTMTFREFENALRQMPFVKLAKKFPLEDWDDMQESLGKEYTKLNGLLMLVP